MTQKLLLPHNPDRTYYMYNGKEYFIDRKEWEAVNKNIIYEEVGKFPLGFVASIDPYYSGIKPNDVYITSTLSEEGAKKLAEIIKDIL